MRNWKTTEENITPPIVCTAPWRVKKVAPLDDFQLHVEFIDGTKGLVLMKDRILSKKTNIFSKLKDIHLFNQVFIEHGVTTWPGEIDLAPDAIHDEIQKSGQWVLK